MTLADKLLTTKVNLAYHSTLKMMKMNRLI